MKLSNRFKLGLKLLRAGMVKLDKESYYLVVLPEHTTQKELEALMREFPKDVKIVYISAESVKVVRIGDA